MVRHISKKLGFLPGWRQHADWYRKTKKYYRQCSEIHRKKGNNYQVRLKLATQQYLSVCELISRKSKDTIQDQSISHTVESMVYVFELSRYVTLLDKHIELTTRRILQEQKIPHKEKMFSIFEDHTEWINKGKLHKKVELGLNTLIATDQYHFILHHHVLQNQVDVHLTIPTARYIQKHYDHTHLSSISYDRNFYSDNAKKVVGKIFDQVILPKPGKKSLQVQQEESTSSFVDLRKKHSAVEANINQLTHHGAKKCPDKGINGFKRYVALSVLAYNVHRLGKLIKHNTS